MVDMSGCTARSGAIDAVGMHVVPHFCQHCLPKYVEDVKIDAYIVGLVLAET